MFLTISSVSLVTMVPTFLLLAHVAMAGPAVADLQLLDADQGDFVVKAEVDPMAGLPVVDMDGAVVTGSVPRGAHLRGYGGRIELEASMLADGVSATESDLVFGESAAGELAPLPSGRLKRGDTTVTGWVGLTDGETRLAKRQAHLNAPVCAVQKGPMVPEHDLELRVTRSPRAGETIPQQTWQDRPSFVMGQDQEGVDAVYASLAPGDQITVVQISGGPRFVEEVELRRSGRRLNWRRDHKGEAVCFEDQSPE